jgi:hypothetical protein
MLTARAITRPRITSEAPDSIPIASLAQCAERHHVGRTERRPAVTLGERRRTLLSGRKLAVSSRGEAIARMHQLGLLAHA